MPVPQLLCILRVWEPLLADAPAKGSHEYAIKRLVKDLKLMWYNTMALKSDGEPAIRRLKDAVKNELAQTDSQYT